jgi:hypothetical protein
MMDEVSRANDDGHGVDANIPRMLSRSLPDGILYFFRVL